MYKLGGWMNSRLCTYVTPDITKKKKKRNLNELHIYFASYQNQWFFCLIYIF